MTISPDTGPAGPQRAESWDRAAWDYGPSRPAPWRMHELLLNPSYHSTAAEHDLVEQIRAANPSAAQQAHTHREFRTRAVHAALDAGVRQFVDVGTGLPTHDPIHQLIAGTPGARVVYTDIDPVAVGYVRLGIGDILDGDPKQARVQQGSFAHPATVLGGGAAPGFIDLHDPICLVLTGLLEYCPSGIDPAAIIAYYRRYLAPGSMVILTQPTIDGLDPTDPAHQRLAAGARTAAACYNTTPTPLTLRGRTEFENFAAGLDLLDGGIGLTATCLNPHSPAEDPALSLCLAAVGRMRP